jgi:proteic killer suppression protein
MLILFKSSKLQKTCNDQRLLRRAFGQAADSIRIRLDDLRSAETLSVIASLPHHKCHELSGNRKGQLAIHLKQPLRLIFEPADEPPALKPDGGIDWSNVRVIRVLEIIDYH